MKALWQIKASEAVERSSLDFFRNIVERIPHMVWTARPDGSIDYVNQHLVSYAGAEPSELLGWGWTRFVHPEQLDITLLRWKDALASGKGYAAENRYRRHDGQYRWHMESVIPWRETGPITYWFGTVTDIDERKNAAAHLEETRQKLEALLDGPSPIGLMEKLSPREREVLQLVVDGYTSAEMAAMLGLAPASVDTYRSRLMVKLNVDNVPALVKFALRHRMTADR